MTDTPEIAHIIYRCAQIQQSDPNAGLMLAPAEVAVLALATWDTADESLIIPPAVGKLPSDDGEPILPRANFWNRMVGDHVVLYPWRCIAATAVVMFVHGYLARKYSDDKRARS